MNSPLEIRKVIWSVILSMLWVCTFIFITPTLVIDWQGDGRGTLTPLKPIINLGVLLIIVLYHMIYKSSAETNKLSWTAVLTLGWLALILFYPFKDPNNYYGGAMGFFALIGGLAVCVLWVRFFSDEIVA